MREKLSTDGRHHHGFFWVSFFPMRGARSEKKLGGMMFGERRPPPAAPLLKSDDVAVQHHRGVRGVLWRGGHATPLRRRYRCGDGGGGRRSGFCGGGAMCVIGNMGKEICREKTAKKCPLFSKPHSLHYTWHCNSSPTKKKSAT